jgi:hypothetical protein
MFRQPTKFLDSDQIIDIIENINQVNPKVSESKTVSNKNKEIQASEEKINNQTKKPHVVKEYKYVGDDIPWLY